MRLYCLKWLVVAASIPAIFGCETNDPITRQHFGEFSFEIPGGWSNVTPDRAKTKARVLLDGTNWQNAKGMIKVDVGTPAFPTAAEMAKSFATSADGRVAPGTLDFDGEIATKATTSSTNVSKPRVIIIIYRGGKSYLVMASGVEGVDVTKAIEHVRSTWKWEG